MHGYSYFICKWRTTICFWWWLLWIILLLSTANDVLFNGHFIKYTVQCDSERILKISQYLVMPKIWRSYNTMSFGEPDTSTQNTSDPQKLIHCDVAWHICTFYDAFWNAMAKNSICLLFVRYCVLAHAFWCTLLVSTWLVIFGLPMQNKLLIPEKNEMCCCVYGSSNPNQLEWANKICKCKVVNTRVTVWAKKPGAIVYFSEYLDWTGISGLFQI